MAGADNDSGGPSGRPLYLHWYKPAYGEGDGTPARHLASVLVRPGTRFDVAFAEPGFEVRTVAIAGRISTEGDRYEADVSVNWRSGERIKGSLRIDIPRGGDVTWFSGAYWSTVVVLTHEESPERFLGTKPMSDQPSSTGANE